MNIKLTGKLNYSEPFMLNVIFILLPNNDLSFFSPQAPQFATAKEGK
jgi:hypothetical protein